MNCIGGFLFLYIDDYEKTKVIFTYLMAKRLEIYFLNNFEMLKKLLYVAEKLIMKFVPKMHKHL